MTVTVIRVAILYILLSVAVRFMGKQQLGDMHPAELVITILLSEIAASSVVDPGGSLLRSVAAVAVLVTFEIINSFIALKSKKYRSLTQGNPLVVISNGCINKVQLERMRMTTDDLYEALRQNDVFDINTVKYGIVETSGKLSVLLKGTEVGE